MRLQAIKLAGFKSFVDPTTVPFPGNLCAVVGPNGCGKSNIIDAVRWVMGESSAKNLRGELMADVIFSGSDTRKAVGQASIELLFDNSEGRLTGAYAGYSEISIQRKLTRDGQSDYFLNGQKCRRKDITDIFLGTGLGPRSYAIIEQGMISQLIEAKPEDLRVYIEEAAGISKYKERRRETERRIGHTRDNLDRLTDIRDELGRQLHHLQRQARAAERYTGLRNEERLAKAQLQALRWVDLDVQSKGKQDDIAKLDVEQEATNAQHRNIDAQIEADRAQRTDLGDQLNEVQKRFYDLGTEIARVEESIAYQQERSTQLQADLAEVNTDRSRIDADMEADQRKIRDVTASLQKTEPELTAAENEEGSSQDRLTGVEQLMQDWQIRWDEYNERSSETRSKAEVEQSGIEHLEQAILRITERLSVLAEERLKLDVERLEEALEPLATKLKKQTEQLSLAQAEIQAAVDSIDAQRLANREHAAALDRERSIRQNLGGRLASLEALQQAALGQQDEHEVHWLEKHGMAGAARLGENLQVADGWEHAVETVFGDHLQAVSVDSLDVAGDLFGDFDQGEIELIEPGSSADGLDDRARLLDKVSSAVNIESLACNVFAVEELSEALAMRHQLASTESVITRDGIWIGPNWLRISKRRDVHAGVIKRQREIGDLKTSLATAELRASDLADRFEMGTTALRDLEKAWEEDQQQLIQAQKAENQVRAELGAKRVQIEQVRTDLMRANREIADGQRQLEQDQDDLRAARAALEIGLDRMEADEKEGVALAAEREANRETLESARKDVRLNKDNAHQLALRQQSMSTQLESTRLALARLNAQGQELTKRTGLLETQVSDGETPRKQLKVELAEQLRQRLAVEQELNELRRKTESVEHHQRTLEVKRAEVEERSERVRSRMEQMRLDLQTVQVRSSTLEEQQQEEGFDLAEVIETLPEDAQEEAFEELVTRMGNRIQRLGPINLAAIDEYKIQSERKEYLDAQNEDLEKALETLRNAIRKIDKETRTRFKETFDNVNAKLQQLFPKLFGGGHAYLEMTGDDLLDTGISLMARPPGKRNTNVHLLSGGEKAMTAIALVFSIFSLNPAPFCLLDEVDAPLDDVNVARYSELVKEMSRTVQFIYITHNKIAMEMAQQLMGVTMEEPGVSRLVSVDVDEAVALAAV